MDHFALLPAAERATVFREAAARSRLGSATIIEKDFWVCWTLQRIFSSPTLPGPLFKGGTSLSKVYKVIERFSEDVDIVLDRHALGFTGDQDPPNIAGTNKRNRKLDELAGKCSETVQGIVRDELQNSFRSVLGEADWKISEDPADADRQSLLFAYPLGLESDLYGLGTYIRPVVRLEFGCRGGCVALGAAVDPAVHCRCAPGAPGSTVRGSPRSSPGTYLLGEGHATPRSLPFGQDAAAALAAPLRPGPIVSARIRPACHERLRPAGKRGGAQEGFLSRSCGAV